jgi:hypothetical protein
MATTPRHLRAWAGMAVLAALIMSAAVTSASAQTPAGDALLERTLAVVGGQAIMASDVAVATRLGLVTAEAGAAPVAPITRLVERQLMLHEVARFAPPEPDAAVVAARVADIRQRAGTPGELQTILDRAGVTMAYVEAWVRDDLRIAAYLEQRFASAGAPTTAEVDFYYQEHIDEFLRAGVSQDEGLRQSRERLTQERRRALIADWLADVRKRTDVIEFPGLY